MLLILAFVGYLGFSSTDQALSETDIAESDKLVTEFMNQYDIPGLSLAWAKEGEIVLAKAYGLASVENQIPLNTDHVFRIASVSKPITSVMIMSLVEQGRLSLDDLVFGQDGILTLDYIIYDGFAPLITVRHLLEHSVGEGWGNLKGNNQVLTRSGLNHHEMVQMILDYGALKQSPGTSYNYSNNGYRVLGRVIEKVTGMSYEKYFHELTAPLNLQDFSIGSNVRSDGYREVHYYSQNPLAAYNYPVSLVDASGGWVTSPTDMVNFLLHVDGFAEPRDILEAATLEEMTRPSQNNPNYAKGWSVTRSNSWRHTGALPGTASQVMRMSNNTVWAAFLNARSSNGNFDRDLNFLMMQITSRGINKLIFQIINVFN